MNQFAFFSCFVVNLSKMAAAALFMQCAPFSRISNRMINTIKLKIRGSQQVGDFERQPQERYAALGAIEEIIHEMEKNYTTKYWMQKSETVGIVKDFIKKKRWMVDGNEMDTGLSNLFVLLTMPIVKDGILGRSSLLNEIVRCGYRRVSLSLVACYGQARSSLGNINPLQQVLCNHFIDYDADMDFWGDESLEPSWKEQLINLLLELGEISPNNVIVDSTNVDYTHPDYASVDIDLLKSIAATPPLVLALEGHKRKKAHPRNYFFKKGQDNANIVDLLLCYGADTNVYWDKNNKKTAFQFVMLDKNEVRFVKHMLFYGGAALRVGNQYDEKVIKKIEKTPILLKEAINYQAKGEKLKQILKQKACFFSGYVRRVTGNKIVPAEVMDLIEQFAALHRNYLDDTITEEVKKLEVCSFFQHWLSNQDGAKDRLEEGLKKLRMHSSFQEWIKEKGIVIFKGRL